MACQYGRGKHKKWSPYCCLARLMGRTKRGGRPSRPRDRAAGARRTARHRRFRQKVFSAPCPAGSWGKELLAWMCAGMKQLAPRCRSRHRTGPGIRPGDGPVQGSEGLTPVAGKAQTGTRPNRRSRCAFRPSICGGSPDDLPQGLHPAHVDQPHREVENRRRGPQGRAGDGGDGL